MGDKGPLADVWVSVRILVVCFFLLFGVWGQLGNFLEPRDFCPVLREYFRHWGRLDDVFN